MNKMLKYHALIAACLITFTAPTCEEEDASERGRKQKQEALQAVSEDFTALSPAERNLRVFEYRAMEKLMDYGDYLCLKYDRNLDSAFRSRAGENIKDLFAGHAAPPDPLPVGMDVASYASLQYLVDSIEVLAPLRKDTTGSYKGRLKYSQKVLGIMQSDTLLLDASLRQMGMLLQMQRKGFGDDTLQVWEVHLYDEP
jgi:hypothetical protein